MKNRLAERIATEDRNCVLRAAALKAAEAGDKGEDSSGDKKRQRKPPPELPADLSTKRILGTRDAAAFLGLSVRDLERKRAAGDMPAPVQLGVRKLGYTVESLIEWTTSRSQKVAA